MVTDPTDMEKLADQEHESWSKWTKWMLGEIKKELAEQNWTMQGESPLELFERTIKCAQRWDRQMNATYYELSEKEKESDRKVVREKLELYRPSNLPALIEKTIETATTAGMEFVAEADGGSWTGRGVGPEDDDADIARKALEVALGLDK